MPDDTSCTLATVLDCEPWEVVERVGGIVDHHLSERLQWEARRVYLEGLVDQKNARIEELQATIDEYAAERMTRQQRLAHARLRAPNPGPFRSAILAALRRGKEWGDIDEASYLTLNAMPCSYCDGPLGNGIGLDRLDVTRGYFLDNVVPSCGPCNMNRHRSPGGRTSNGRAVTVIPPAPLPKVAPWVRPTPEPVPIEPGSLRSAKRR